MECDGGLQGSEGKYFFNLRAEEKANNATSRVITSHRTVPLKLRLFPSNRETHVPHVVVKHGLNSRK
jgi:hypothetical protein